MKIRAALKTRLLRLVYWLERALNEDISTCLKMLNFAGIRVPTSTRRIFAALQNQTYEWQEKNFICFFRGSKFR